MSLETGKVETDVLFNRLSYKQVRHIVLLEAIVELAKFSVGRWKKHDSEGACGIDDAIDVVVKDMMGIDDRAWTITCYNPKKTSLNQLLFKKVDVSEDKDQMLIYESAIATSKYRLKKLFCGCWQNEA